MAHIFVVVKSTSQETNGARQNFALPHNMGGLVM